MKLIKIFLFAVFFINSTNAFSRVIRKSGFDVKKNFCACFEGKSDIAKQCDSFCTTKNVTDVAVLYGEVDYISKSPTIKNLYDWCSVQLSTDETIPQCVLNAVSEEDDQEINLPVNIRPGQNTFSAQLSTLSKNKIWRLKLVEVKTGSKAQSRSIHLARIHQLP